MPRSPATRPQPARQCANCGAILSGPGAVKAGPDAAWHRQCLECHLLVAGQLTLIADEPNGAHIAIYQCASGASRACRPGWHTRCHVCLDARSRGPVVAAAGQSALTRLAGNRELGEQLKAVVSGAPDDQVRARAIVELSSALTLASAIRDAQRPGWSVLATDIHGLPWTGQRLQIQSHGTWLRHDECGAVTKLGSGAVDCPACGPAPGSRTHLARRDEPYLLYLVVHGRWQKFGVGDRGRVRSHLRGGAHVTQVLRASFQQAVLAERALKQRYRQEIIGRRKRGMMDSFGQGTEVISRRQPISLREVLPDGEDITDSFR